MGTTSSFFGGGGGGTGHAGANSNGTYLPLDTELPLYMPYYVVNTEGVPMDSWAGNPLGNGYSCKWVSATQFRIGNTSQSAILNVSPTTVNAAANYLGGACYLSNGNILVLASTTGSNPTFYYSEFEYDTGNKPTGGLDGSFSPTVSYSAFNGSTGYNYLMLNDGSQFRIQGTQIWCGRTLNMSSFTFQGWNGEGAGTIVGSNGIAIQTRIPTGSTTQTTQLRVRRVDRSSDIASQTGNPFSATLNIGNPHAPYSLVFAMHSTSTTRPRYIGYPDGKVWTEGAGLLFKLSEYDAMCAEFQTKYVDVWES